MFKKNKQPATTQKDPIDLEVEAIMGPLPGEVSSSQAFEQTEPQINISTEDQAYIDSIKEEPLTAPIVGTAEEKSNIPEMVQDDEPISEVNNEADKTPTTQSEDIETKEAVKDIIAKESDELLAASDQNKKLQEKPEKKPKISITKVVALLLLTIILISILATLFIPSVHTHLFKLLNI